MKYNEKNTIVDNVLDQDEIEQIYSRLESPYKKYVMRKYGQQVSDFWMPESALNKIVSIAEIVSGISGLKLEAYQFSRYEKFVREDGTLSMPNLTPHFDTFPEPRFTFDLQIGSNTDWSIFVEDKEFMLKDNQALTFSGTHQIHWRSKKVFEDGEFIDMIFCHLYLPGNAKNAESHWNLMRDKEEIYTEKFGVLPWIK